jgi:hypothetical protein
MVFASARRVFVNHRFGLPQSIAAVTLALTAMLPVAAVRADDWANQARLGRQMADAWARNCIAIIQAEHGDVLGGKKTALEISEPEGVGPIPVTLVRSCNGQAICIPLLGPCDSTGQPLPPVPAVGSYDAQRASYFSGSDRAPDRVPAKVPSGLAANYLAPDPRHGAVVDFVDERDTRGTRVTSRKYADGYVVIETPHPEGK